MKKPTSYQAVTLSLWYIM